MLGFCEEQNGQRKPSKECSEGKQPKDASDEKILETQEESEEDDEITLRFSQMEKLCLGPRPYSTAI
jgi:hypothetical protein